MRTTIIPAQITTVEDKIAGSFNLAQILILMAPVLLTAIVYALFLPVMQFCAYKFLIIIVAAIIALILALRIKDKIVAEWLSLLISYQLQPKYYLFNKNDLTHRQLTVHPLVKEKIIKKKVSKKLTVDPNWEMSLLESIKLQNLIDSGKVALRYQLKK